VTPEAVVASTETPIELTVPKAFPPELEDDVRQRLDGLRRFTDEPLLNLRLTLRSPGGHSRTDEWVADASAVVNGRLLAAHATGPHPLAATDAVVERLRRQLRRTAGAEVARRNEPRVLAKALAEIAADERERPATRPRPRTRKPPELRDLLPARTWAPGPEGTFDAVADLLDLDLHFLLFTHARTREDVVVHRRDDGRVGLLHPPGSALADENDIVVPEPSRYPEPIPLERARGEMDVLDHRFLYFIDAADGRGKVIYLRHDGDYGLVTPD
jgi:ribosome-associated translation inhibitor RaiA